MSQGTARYKVCGNAFGISKEEQGSRRGGIVRMKETGGSSQTVWALQAMVGSFK